VICSPTVAARLPLEVRARLLLAEDPEQWVEQLRPLIDDPARAQAIGEENQRVAREHYSPEAILPQLEAAYLRAS
jgi:glycosyltransferase involved in cell wall biosynthesis